MIPLPRQPSTISSSASPSPEMIGVNCAMTPANARFQTFTTDLRRDLPEFRMRKNVYLTLWISVTRRLNTSFAALNVAFSSSLGLFSHTINARHGFTSFVTHMAVIPPVIVSLNPTDPVISLVGSLVSFYTATDLFLFTYAATSKATKQLQKK